MPEKKQGEKNKNTKTVKETVRQFRNIQDLPIAIADRSKTPPQHGQLTRGQEAPENMFDPEHIPWLLEHRYIKEV